MEEYVKGDDGIKSITDNVKEIANKVSESQDAVKNPKKIAKIREEGALINSFRDALIRLAFPNISITLDRQDEIGNEIYDLTYYASSPMFDIVNAYGVCYGNKHNYMDADSYEISHKQCYDLYTLYSLQKQSMFRDMLLRDLHDFQNMVHSTYDDIKMDCVLLSKYFSNNTDIVNILRLNPIMNINGVVRLYNFILPQTPNNVGGPTGLGKNRTIVPGILPMHAINNGDERKDFEDYYKNMVMNLYYVGSYKFTYLEDYYYHELLPMVKNTYQNYCSENMEKLNKMLTSLRHMLNLYSINDVLSSMEDSNNAKKISKMIEDSEFSTYKNNLRAKRRKDIDGRQE